MHSADRLSNAAERILMTLWKLRGVGKNTIREETLKAALSTESPAEGLSDHISNLHKQGFVEANSVEGHNSFSLTPLGLAILRQIEEDRLQELK